MVFIFQKFLKVIMRKRGLKTYNLLRLCLIVVLQINRYSI